MNNYGQESAAALEKTSIAIGIQPTAKGKQLFQKVEAGGRDVYYKPGKKGLNLNDHTKIEGYVAYDRTQGNKPVAAVKNTPNGPVRKFL